MTSPTTKRKSDADFWLDAAVSAEAKEQRYRKSMDYASANYWSGVKSYYLREAIAADPK